MLKVGVQTGGGLYHPFGGDPDSSFKFIRECGFDAVDFNIDNYVSISHLRKESLDSVFDQSEEELFEYFRPVKEAAEKHGVAFSQMHAPFPVWCKEEDAFNEYILMVVAKCIAVCGYMNCPAIVVHSITRSSKENEWNTNMAIYRALMPAAKKYNVKICLENLFDSFKGRIVEGACSNVDEAVRYIDTLNAEAGCDCFGFCLDIGHANLLGRNLRWYIQKLGKRLTCLHIHDNNGTSDLHMMPYTYTHNWGKDLVCDWEGFLQGLADIKYEGALAFETFRVLGAFPKPLWPDALKLISATGRYWIERINALRAEAETQA